MGNFRIKMLSGILVSLILLTGCAAGSTTGNNTGSPETLENVEIESAVLSASEACKEMYSQLKYFDELLKLLTKELLDSSSPRKKRIQSIASEMIETGNPLLEIRVEDETVQKEITDFGDDIVTFGQTLVDGFDFFEDDQPAEALEELQLSLLRVEKICK
jgi:hypothetical protein